MVWSFGVSHLIHMRVGFGEFRFGRGPPSKSNYERYRNVNIHKCLKYMYIYICFRLSRGQNCMSGLGYVSGYVAWYVSVYVS